MSVPFSFLVLLGGVPYEYIYIYVYIYIYIYITYIYILHLHQTVIVLPCPLLSSPTDKVICYSLTYQIEAVLMLRPPWRKRSVEGLASP